MHELNKAIVDKAISEIKSELKSFPISEHALQKFKDSKIDNEAKALLSLDGYLKFMPALIKKLGIKNILELGNREGLSTLSIWDHLPLDGHFISIDIEKDLRYCPEAMFTDPRVRFIYGDVSDPQIYNGVYPDQIEFMFMDTIHYEFQVTDEFEANQFYLADKALVAIDDIHLNDKGKFFEKLPYQKWDLTELCHASGWGLFLFERKIPMSREQRIFEAYKTSQRIFKRKFDEQSAILNRIDHKKLVNIGKRTIKRVGLLYRGLLFIRNKFK
jgi:predicted O-methyltransferase YrrM